MTLSWLMRQIQKIPCFNFPHCIACRRILQKNYTQAREEIIFQTQAKVVKIQVAYLFIRLYAACTLSWQKTEVFREEKNVASQALLRRILLTGAYYIFTERIFQFILREFMVAAFTKHSHAESCRSIVQLKNTKNMRNGSY